MTGSDVESRFARSGKHTTHYLEAGPKDGRAVVLVHGWPELSLARRNQVKTLSDLGFHVIAPDLRGCGGSTIYDKHAAYSQREIVRDMIDLADLSGIGEAFWWVTIGALRSSPAEVASAIAPWPRRYDATVTTLLGALPTSGNPDSQNCQSCTIPPRA